MEQTPVIFQFLELLPKLAAAGASLTFSLDEKRLDLRQLHVELVEKC
jgi:hypothetical protein